MIEFENKKQNRIHKDWNRVWQTMKDNCQTQDPVSLNSRNLLVCATCHKANCPSFKLRTSPVRIYLSLLSLLPQCTGFSSSSYTAGGSETTWSLQLKSAIITSLPAGLGHVNNSSLNGSQVILSWYEGSGLERIFLRRIDKGLWGQACESVRGLPPAEVRNSYVWEREGGREREGERESKNVWEKHRF